LVLANLAHQQCRWEDENVGDLAGLISIGGNLAEVLLVFMAKTKLQGEQARMVGAFDGSGKEDRRILVVAGFVSRSADWQSFHKEWTARLAQDGLTYFHMVDFASSRDQFVGWDKDEPGRRRLLGGLMDIIRSHVYRKFGCVVENSQFYRLSKDNQKEFSLNAYSLAGRSCVADVALWKRQEAMSHVPIAYVFEEGDDGVGLLTDRMLKDGHSRPHFLPKKDRTGPDGSPINAYTPLQAADMLAYELAKRTNDVLNGKGDTKFRWALREFDRIPGEPGMYSPKDLTDLDKNLNDISSKEKADALSPNQ
jgi:hypothetical protein